jgi:light-regulated signal transduction histidine kinase (bacteriophytochrome)
VCGLSIIRGTPAPVVDIGLLLGEQPTRADRLVAIRVGKRIVALAVDPHDCRRIGFAAAPARGERSDCRRERVDLTAIARSVAAGLRRANRERRVELVVADGLLADGDANLMTVAVENLIGNAWKYTGKTEAARIEVGFIEGERDEPRTYFVRDNGAGFDMAYAGKLFGMFQRLHANTEFEGNGIGLATVQRIVRRHGGRIWAEGAVGCGATFFFTLAGGARPPVLMSAPARASGP